MHPFHFALNTDAASERLLRDITRDALGTLMLVTLAVAWLWATAMELIAEMYVIPAYTALGFLIAVVLLSYRLRDRYCEWAVGIYVFGMVAVITFIAMSFGNLQAFYLYALAVLIAGILTSVWGVISVALTSIASMLIIGLNGTSYEPLNLALAITVTVLTGIAVWLVSKELRTALTWVYAMSQQSQQNADEARTHRAELQRVLHSLDQAYVRLERTNQALIFAQEAAETAYRFKSEFVANVSHELRTPLNLIVGFSEMVATAPESYGGIPLPKEYRGDVMAIYRSARHLLDLVNDVLDLSQIEANKMPIVRKPSELTEIINEAAEIVDGLASVRDLQLRLDVQSELPVLNMDRTRVRQILLNLLTNAVRFTQKGEVCVRAFVAGGEVVVEVADTGPGIEPVDLARAFEAFSQMHEQQIPAGSGLGLAVSKKFVELHGGRMWIDSKVGRGTTISFTLPIPDSDQYVPLSRLHVSRPLRHEGDLPTVLLLHGDTRALSILHRHINTCEIMLAQTPVEATELIKEAAPRAIIIDRDWATHWAAHKHHWQMPVDLPVITCPIPNVHDLYGLEGAVDYLPKPVSREDLASALQRLGTPVHSVLIIDDNPHVVRLLSRMLKAVQGSLRIWEAFGCEEGLEIIRTRQPDVVLLDLVLPEMSGYDLLNEIARDKALANVQVIVVSVRGIGQTPVVSGHMSIRQETGFTWSGILQLLDSVLGAVTRPDAKSLTSDAARLEVQPG